MCGYHVDWERKAYVPAPLPLKIVELKPEPPTTWQRIKGFFGFKQEVKYVEEIQEPATVQ